MDYQNNYLYEKRPNFTKSKAPAVKWVRDWVSQDVASSGGRCTLLRWVTKEKLAKLQEKTKAVEVEEAEPEPTSEILFMCSFEGCGKTFMDAGALRKHSHIHGERQFICHFEGCGKKFLDSSKLKRHFLIHTGERPFICHHDGCGKAFSLDFNLRAHMRTHSQENYHICPHADCGKRYAHEYKLKTHIKTHHEKNGTPLLNGTPSQNVTPEVVRRMPPTPMPPTPMVSKHTPVIHHKPPPMDRPYACPYKGCDKSYIHEYKLNLHFKREHPGHGNTDDNGNNHTPEADNEIDDTSDQDVYAAKSKGIKRSKPSNPVLRMPPSRSAQSKASVMSTPSNMDVLKKQWADKGVYVDEDSEETEDEDDNVDDNNKYRYTDVNEDDEETEDED